MAPYIRSTKPGGSAGPDVGWNQAFVHPSACFALFATIAVPNPGCGGTPAAGDAPEGTLGDSRVRQQCDPGGRRVGAVDVNNDGEPDIRHVFEGERESCVQFDMNFDGLVDITRFFGEGGAIVQEEHDFDFDGRIDQIAYFDGGELARKELDTNFDNRIDTWIWCEGRLLDRQERERYHNGHVDTWEYFERGILREARYDDNNDRQPERWELFRGGVLYEIRRDTDLDGDADQREEIPRESAGDIEAALTCDGSAPPPPEPEPTSGNETPAPEEPAPAENANPNSQEGTPWENTPDVPPSDDMEEDE
jgi:hypothetical protein